MAIASREPIAGFDIVRFAAAALVTIFHLGTETWAAPGTVAAKIVDGRAAFPELFSVTWSGFIGVEIFFVISGFRNHLFSHGRPELPTQPNNAALSGRLDMRYGVCRCGLGFPLGKPASSSAQLLQFYVSHSRSALGGCRLLDPGNRNGVLRSYFFFFLRRKRFTGLGSSAI